MKTLSFIRKPVEFEGRFTQIPNTWARDSRLGYRAKGILLLLMSHQDGWRISLEHLANDGPDGITAVRTAIQQLQECGYLVRTIIRNDKNQIEGSEWIISDPFESSENLSLENLTSENLTSENLEENLTSENLALKKTNIKEDNRNSLVDSEFENFWQSYPRKVGKASAKKAFIKACKKLEPKWIVDCVNVWVAKGNLPEIQFIPYPATWLNQERWHDDVSALPQSKNASTVAADIMKRASEMTERFLE